MLTLFHSTNNPVLFLEALRQRDEAVIYATNKPQGDYGKFVVGFKADVGSLNDSYDYGGGYAPMTGNFCIPLSSIDESTVRVNEYSY